MRRVLAGLVRSSSSQCPGDLYRKRQAILWQGDRRLGAGVAPSASASTNRLPWQSAKMPSAPFIIFYRSGALMMRIFSRGGQALLAHLRHTVSRRRCMHRRRRRNDRLPRTPTLDQSTRHVLRHRPARSPRPTPPSASPLHAATPSISKSEATALASNMRAGFETAMNLAQEETARRLQNIIKHLVGGEPVVKVVYEAVQGDIRHDAKAFIDTPRLLVEKYPTSGDSQN